MAAPLPVSVTDLSFRVFQRTTHGRGDAQWEWKTLLDRVSFQLEAGTTCAVVGVSGVGKSTLLKLIAGLIKPDSGAVKIGELSPAEAQKQQLIGYVPQDKDLLPWKTVASNIVFPPFGLNDELDCQQLADDLGLRHLLTRRVGKLSGGELARVALMRALVRQPSILLMDEPLASVDIRNRRLLWDHIDGFVKNRRRKVTCIFITHDLHEVQRMADSAIVLSDIQLDRNTSVQRVVMLGKSEVTVDKLEELIR